MKKIVVSLGFVILLSAFITPEKDPPQIINDEFEFSTDYSTINPCTGEEVFVTGVFHFSMHGMITEKRGSFIIKSQGNLTGTDNSGNTYDIHVNSISPASGNLLGGQIMTKNNYIALFNSSNGSSSFRVSQFFQITVNANGTLTVFRSKDNGLGQCLGN
jgi:hypothetical protein